MSDLEWKDPPPTQRAGLAEIAGVLRSRPGEWALVRSNAANATARQWNRGGAASFPAAEFEFVLRNSNSTTHRGDVYGRYIGATP